jgi:release factor glutamine methyltransferase
VSDVIGPTIEATLASATRRLLEDGRRAGSRAASDAEVLLGHVLGWPRGTLIARGDLRLAVDDLARFEALVQRRITGEPVAYLTGRREFWSLELEVDANVLVPRPETELLVELALQAIAGRRSPRVADLGTGSGAVALAVATERPDAEVVAVDTSPAALQVARHNALRLGRTNVTFLSGSWYAPLAGQRFDLVLSNPPYLADDDPHLPSLRHEPAIALACGPTGEEALAAVTAGAPAHLAPGGMLAVEHGMTQGAAVRAMMAAAGLLRPATHRDLAGLDRVTSAQSR